MTQPHSTEGDAPSIRRAQQHEEARLLDTLTLAFSSDPAARWTLPEAAQYLRFFPQFARAFGGVAISRQTAWADDRLMGAALWLAPGTHPDEDALNALVEACTPPAQRAHAGALFEAMAAHHPSVPHWYLPMIGVDPRYQGRGLGTRLLAPALAECDRAQICAYLERDCFRLKHILRF